MKEFIRIQNTVLAVDAIISIEQEVSTVGKGRPEDERGWALCVKTATDHFYFRYNSRKEMEADFESLWNYLAE